MAEILRRPPEPVNRVGTAVATPDEPLRARPWIWPTLLSLDAPLVAILWQLLFAATLRTRVAPAATAVMALAVWLIYVSDRILDSFQADENTQQPLRHRFYRAHRMAFLPPFLAILVFTCWLAFTQLDPRTLRAGIVLGLAIGFYFVAVHALGRRAQECFPKELVVAILFAAGSCLPVWVEIREFEMPLLLPISLFVVVLWMNALLIEYTEWLRLREGEADRPHSTTILGGRFLVPLGVAIGTVALAASAAKTFDAARPLLLAEGASALALSGIGLRWRRVPSHIVRLAADAALLTPAISLILFRR
jgi:hypothetical protein